MKVVEAQVIVIGGGLAGLSAAHTVLENGGGVVLLDKMKFLGGNSTRATSGINGARLVACARASLGAPGRAGCIACDCSSSDMAQQLLAPRRDPPPGHG